MRRGPDKLQRAKNLVARKMHRSQKPEKGRQGPYQWRVPAQTAPSLEKAKLSRIINKIKRWENSHKSNKRHLLQVKSQKFLINIHCLLLVKESLKKVGKAKIHLAEQLGGKDKTTKQSKASLSKTKKPNKTTGIKIEALSQISTYPSKVEAIPMS